MQRGGSWFRTRARGFVLGNVALGKRSSLLWCGVVVAALSACGSDPAAGGGGAAGTGSDDPSMNGNAGTSSPNDPRPMAGRGGAMSKPPEAADPCEGAGCGPGQRCEADGGTAECVDNGCDDLDCGAGERCEAGPRAATPARTRPATTTSTARPISTAARRGCARTTCARRACAPATAASVFECSGNGGEIAERFACASAAYFETQCVEASAGAGELLVRGRLGLPGVHRVRSRPCTGTGVAPSCSLPPIPFSDTPPAVELHWGGDDRDAPTRTTARPSDARAVADFSQWSTRRSSRTSTTTTATA